MARIISIVNQKGGTGKSACTANLAVGLAQKNMKVLIVDADPQSDVSAGFGYRDCDDSNETLTALMDAVMKILSRYVGWGGLADAFDEIKSAWETEYLELKTVLTPEEYAAARASTLNAHYTQDRYWYRKRRYHQSIKDAE